MPRFLSVAVAALVASFELITASPIESRATADVSCTPYKPIGWKIGRAKINFYDNNPNNNPANGPGFHANTLPANITITPSGFLYLANHNTSQGEPATLSACNVTSQGLTTNTTQSSCTHGSCYHAYTNYVRVLNPATGHCLTTRNYNASVSSFDYRPCDDNPKNKAQIFTTYQQVTYAPGYTSIYSYGNVDFENTQNIVDEDQILDGIAYAWSLSRADNRTVQVVQAQYTQVGLSANLLPADV